jgi:hypothetical protein
MTRGIVFASSAAAILLPLSRPLSLVCTLLALSIAVPCQDTTVYSNSALAFRYRPPAEMLDQTQSGREQIRDRAAAIGDAKVFDLLLSMTSGGNDASPAWHSLTIESYPRSAFPNLDDATAEAKVGAWVAGFTDVRQIPKRTSISGQDFAVSVFATQEGAVRKGAVVWTTTRKGKVLSFAFVANSPLQLKVLAETMKTVEFF